MRNSRTLWLRAIACAFACAAIAPFNLPAQSAASKGVFEASSDVGSVLHPGAVKYDAPTHSYTVSGSGGNMWFASDAFQFVWKRISGDVTFTADVAFPVDGGNAHRKAVLMIRQSLDADSAYADAALHGDGLTSLQARTEKGAVTHEVQANETAPGRLRIVRRGEQVSIYLARTGEPLGFAGGSMRLSLHEPYYIGIGVCSHDKDAVATAVFSNVEISTGAPSAVAQSRLYSTIETVSVASTDARVAYLTAGRVEAPSWTQDGASLLFSKGGQIGQVAAAGGQPQAVDTQSAMRCDSHHSVSPDGQSLAFGDDSQQPGKTAIYVVPVAGGMPRRVTPNAPSWGPTWSPDGKTLAFTAVRGGQLGIYTIPVAGGDETPLITGPGRNEAPEFAPDGAYIYFNSTRSGSRQVWRMRPDGSAQEQVTDDDYNNLYPHVSPDGKRIVFLSYDKKTDVPQDQAVLLRTMILGDRQSPGKPAFLAAFNGGLGSIDAPSWSPDSKRLAFVSYQMIP